MTVKIRNKNDLRFRYSEDLIQQAVIDIISEKKSAKISVSELIKRCDINRGTFYNHYASIDELIKVMCFRFISECFSKIKGDKAAITTEVLIDVLNYVKKNRKLFELMVSDEYRLTTINSIVNFVSKKYFGEILASTSIDNELKTMVVFMVNGSIAVVYEWCKNGYRPDLELVAEKIARLNHSVANNYLNN